MKCICLVLFEYFSIATFVQVGACGTDAPQPAPKGSLYGYIGMAAIHLLHIYIYIYIYMGSHVVGGGAGCGGAGSGGAQPGQLGVYFGVVLGS